MYWPIGTPSIYAASSSHAPAFKPVASYDGLPGLSSSDATSPRLRRSRSRSRSDHGGVEAPSANAPLTPTSPSAEPQDDNGGPAKEGPEPSTALEAGDVSLKEPILALRVARSGQLFVVVTATTITVWQTKPSVILALVARSESSLQQYGKNVDLMLRPDSAIVVIHTDQGYLITYSLATDGESRVYKPHFPNYNNVQRRRQNLLAGSSGLQADQFLWGPGEGSGIRDVSVRFRMVIKIDAGIESALALDDELVVATQKPAAVQCIRWTPDSTGNQTRTEILSRMDWMEKKISVVEMTYDRPMNLLTWVTSDGSAYAVQRCHPHRQADSQDEADSKRLFKGHCFHVPHNVSERATRAVINARFSLIAVGCSDGTVQVYSVRNYAGDITHSHSHKLPISSTATGTFTTLSYSPDGYCLFAGFENGWATWSMFGKPGSNSFGAEGATDSDGEDWLSGVTGASWIGAGSELLLTGTGSAATWCLEMAKSAVTGCYGDSNIFRTVLQTPTGVMVYRGYDLPDLTSISAEPFLWHSTKVPAPYLLNQWPIRQTVISPDGRYVAVAGRRGLAHYSINSGRWRTFADPTMENEFQVRGGMCWYKHILVAAVESHNSHEIRLFSREAPLDGSRVLYTQQVPSPVVLITMSGEDSLLVYTFENLLYHFVFVPWGESVRMVQVGQIAFHGIVRSPARVRGLSWILPQGQLADGDPSQDVAVATILFLVDGKLVLLRPSLSEEGQLKYDMRVIAQNVEYHAAMRDQPVLNVTRGSEGESLPQGPPTLDDSLWIFDGTEMKAWGDIKDILEAASGDGSREMPEPISVPVDFYPLSVLLEKGIALGVESDLVQRRDVNFCFFHFAIRTHLVLPDILRDFLGRGQTAEAATLSRQFRHLEYFPHALEMLLHRVLEEEADTSPEPEKAVLPRILSLLSSFKEYLDIVLQCTRKTEARQWKTLFAYLPPAQELFEESLQSGSLKTAGGYLIILRTLEELDSATEQSARLLSRAMRQGDWDLCQELARFLAAMDETGEILEEAMRLAKGDLSRESDGQGAGRRLGIPSGRIANGGSRTGSGEEELTESDNRSTSDGASIASTLSPTREA